MENKENILEQIRKERAELERFRKEIAKLILEIRDDQDNTPQKCALSIQEVKEELRKCSDKKGGGSVYDSFFSRPKQEKKDEDEEALRKKKLDASKKSGGYKPQM